MVAKVSSKMNVNRRLFFKCSGLDPSDFETKRHPDKPDKLYIIYRDPVTHKRMTTPNGKVFSRYRIFKPEDGKKYRTRKHGGVHLYFPSCDERGQVVDYLKANPDAPIYITEGEKKAAKAWLEGIPCIGIPGIWCWLANKEDRSNDEKILHPDFNYIPDLERRGVIMVYDSDAIEPQKKDKFDQCSEDFEKCLRARGVGRYEKIILPSIEGEKTGLDDYLLEHSVWDFKKIVAEQSKTVPLGQYIMTAKEFLSTNFPPIKFILQPWLSDCGLTMIHSAPGVGKTFFLLGMSVAITRKKLPEDFCGWKIKRGAGVLFVDGEMPSTIMQRRLAIVEAAYPNNPASKKNPLSLLSCMDVSRRTGKRINFSDEHWRNEFSKIIAKLPAKIIILDNIVSLMSTKDENDAGAWSVINKWLLYLRGIGKSVIIVHHSSKHGTQRGTSHRSDNLDTIIKLKNAEGDGIIINFEKHRNFGVAEAKPVNIDFRIEDNKAVFEEGERANKRREKRNRKIKAMLDAGKSQKKIADHFGLSKGRVSQIVKEIKEDEEDS